MDDQLIIAQTDSRIQKIQNFIKNNKKKIFIVSLFIFTLIISLLLIKEFKENQRIKLAEQYNSVSIDFLSGKKNNIEDRLIQIIRSKDKTYSPLALFFLIDNKIIDSNEELNKLFNVIINEINIDEEIKNLVIYKKALLNSDFETENNLLNMLNPVIQSDSIWKPHALFLMAEYFYSKNELQKSKEFFNKILLLENTSQSIKLETQKRIRRDFSE